MEILTDRINRMNVHLTEPQQHFTLLKIKFLYHFTLDVFSPIYEYLWRKYFFRNVLFAFSTLMNKSYVITATKNFSI